MAIDLAIFDLEAEAEAGAPMELVAPRGDKAAGVKQGDPLGFTIQVLGEDSPTYRHNIRLVADEIQRNLSAEPKDPDTADKLAKARVAACAVTGWSGDALFGGKTPEFSRDAAVELFFERPWIARQVENFRRIPGNFGPR